MTDDNVIHIDKPRSHLQDPHLASLSNLLQDADTSFGLYKNYHWDRIVQDDLAPWLAAHDQELLANVAASDNVAQVIYDHLELADAGHYVLAHVHGALAAGFGIPDHARGYRHEYRRLQAQPAPGWFVFGSHIDEPDILLEFWGDDAGTPIWERPIQ